MKKPDKTMWEDLGKMTVGAAALIVGNYFFKFPNNFAFGGVAGFAVVLAKILPWTVGTINFVMNMALLLVGFLALSKSFGVKTVYVTILFSFGLSAIERWYPLSEPLTKEPVLEFAFAIILTAVGSGILFQCNASSGGTDIIAMILRKYSGANIAYMLLVTDLVVAVAAFFIFDIQTALFSFLGLLIKTIVIDNTIASINRRKYAHIVCDRQEEICDFIIHTLNRSATVCEAEGAYTHKQKFIIMCVLKGREEILLRKFIKETEPEAFMLVSNTSEIFGKGFLSMD